MCALDVRFTHVYLNGWTLSLLGKFVLDLQVLDLPCQFVVPKPDNFDKWYSVSLLCLPYG